MDSRWLLPVSRRRGQTTRPYLPSQARAEEEAEASAKGQDNSKTTPKKVSNTSVRKRVEAFYKKDAPPREDPLKGTELKKVAELRRAAEVGTKKKDFKVSDAARRKEAKRKDSEPSATKSPERSPRKGEQSPKKRSEQSKQKEVTYTSKKDIPLSPTRVAEHKHQYTDPKPSVEAAASPPGRPTEGNLTGKGDIGLPSFDPAEPEDSPDLSDMSRRTDFSSASSRLGSQGSRSDYRPLGSRDYRPSASRYDYRSSPTGSRSDYRSSPHSDYRASPVRTDYSSSISSLGSRTDYSPATLRAHRPEFVPAEVPPRSPATRTRASHQSTTGEDRQDEVTSPEPREVPRVARVELTLLTERTERPPEVAITDRRQRERLKSPDATETPVLAERSTSVSTGPRGITSRPDSLSASVSTGPRGITSKPDSPKEAPVAAPAVPPRDTPISPVSPDKVRMGSPGATVAPRKVVMYFRQSDDAESPHRAERQRVRPYSVIGVPEEIEVMPESFVGAEVLPVGSPRMLTRSEVRSPDVPCTEAAVRTYYQPATRSVASLKTSLEWVSSPAPTRSHGDLERIRAKYQPRSRVSQILGGSPIKRNTHEDKTDSAQKEMSPQRLVTRPISPRVETKTMSPERVETRPITPQRTETRPMTPQRVETRPMTPQRVETRPMTPQRVETNTMSPQRVETRPMSPQRVETKTMSPQRVETRPVSPQRVATKTMSPQRVETKESPPPKAATDPNPSSSASQAPEEDDFNHGLILPPLLVQLKKILEQYPDDSQILKELLQNAEDAGARVVRFLHDRKSHSANPRALHHPGLAKYQGPALYAYNDAVFDDEDWKGVRMLSQSVKQHDRFKVGYFGMGFKSIFHLTDLPCILSGDRLGMIDPHQKVFPLSTHSWNLSRQRTLLRTLPDQFAPFLNVLECTRETFSQGWYPGTLFRFPLRAQPSVLSETIYTQERVQRLFQTFEEDAELVLLFLRHLECVELLERDENTMRPRLVYRVQVAPSCLEVVRQHRQTFLASVAGKGKWLDQPLQDTFPITIEATTRTGHTEHTRTFSWLVTNYYSGGHVSAVFRKLYVDVELSYPPWVGVAMATHDSYTAEEGHVFCFLPLPAEKQTPTGLPVHVNGFFALEQNRKYIKWPTYRQQLTDLLDKRLLWNQCLLKEALPCAYTALLLAAIERHRSGQAGGLTPDMIYRAFPSFQQVDRRWEPILVPLFAELLKHPVVYTAAAGGRWVTPREAIFNTLEEDEHTRDIILRVLSKGDVRVAHVPAHVLHAVKTCCHINLGRIQPSLVAAAYKDVQQALGFTWDEKMALLKYLSQQQKYDLLDGLELLPLADGTITVFFTNPRRADRDIFVSSQDHPLSILPNMARDLLDPEVDLVVKKYLIKGATKGYTQLKLLTKELVSELLHKFLPADWLRQQSVMWAPGHPGQPPADWLADLWTYLQRNYPKDLALFDSLPLLPVTRVDEPPVKLVPLYNSHGVLLRELDGLSLEDDLEEVLRNLGTTIIDELPLFVRNHPLVSELYVHGPNSIGVLKVLFRMCQRMGMDPFTQCVRERTNQHEKRQLRTFFARMSAFDLQFRPEFRQVLHRLPLFETVAGSGSSASQFVSAHEVQLAAPPETITVHLSQRIIDTSAPDSASLAALLRVRRLTPIQMLREIIFPDVEAAFYSLQDVQTLMVHVLRHYHSYMEADPSFGDTIRTQAFMMRRDTLLTADRFYFPDNELLQKLFLGENYFPSGPYAEASNIAILKELGLRDLADVEPEDLLETAHQIEDSIANGGRQQQEAKIKSGALMEYLQKFPDKLQESVGGTSLHRLLADIKWVTPIMERPAFYPDTLQWYRAQEVFVRPSECKHIVYASTVGSSMPVVDDGPDGTLGNVFGWTQPPSIDRVISQLSQLVKNYDATQKAKFMNLVDRVYKEVVIHSVVDVKQALQSESLTDWIWHGEGFTGSQNMTFRVPFMDLRPFVYNIPKEMEKYGEFFREFGANQDCHLPHVLRTVQQKYCNGGTQYSVTEVKRDMHLCVSILNELKSRITEDSLPTLQKELVLPVHAASLTTLKMAPLEDCTFCDQEWMRQGYDMKDLAEDNEELLFVHPNVPNSTSEALGVPTLMSRMLDAEELDFSFGQSDSLTHRLSVLLQEYTDGFAVPKELIQNADDAGATEVKLLYDQRENDDAKTCLIDEGMRECQGPALWAYNDAVFCDEDFENITKLSGATKERKTEMVGSFGLGFNAVYNLTDVPSFISRHNIVIFDPHTTHLGRSIKNKSKPGIKIDMRKHKRKLRRLGNQFKPFNGIFGCDMRPQSLQESYHGTLFRFPLRTKAQAIKSEICQKHYDAHEVKLLLQMLIKGAESLLLFTQNVTRISVYHIPPSRRCVGEPQEIFTVRKAPVQIMRELNFQGTLSDQILTKSSEYQTFSKQNNVLQTAKHVLTRMKQGMKVPQHEIPKASTIVSIETRCAVAAEKLLNVKNVSQRRPWMIVAAFGSDKSLKMALTSDTLSPVGGVAVPLKLISSDSKYSPSPIVEHDNPDRHNGLVFSFLPLPVHSGLPVHVNGSFAVASSRRHLCERNEDDKFDMRSQWNEALFEDCVCRAYMILLEDLSQIIPPESFTTLWPKPCILQPLEGLVQNLYQAFVGTYHPQVFADHRSWASIQESVFLDPNFRKSAIGNLAVKLLRQCLDGTNEKMIDLPGFAQQFFAKAGAYKKIQEHSLNLAQFLRTKFFPYLERFDPRDRDVIVLHALEQDDKEVSAMIITTPCIPCSPNGERLRMPKELVDPSVEIAGMFEAKDSRFPIGKYATRLMLNTLQSLGMARDDISWNDVIERVRSLPETEYAAARRRVQCILVYLEKKLARIEFNEPVQSSSPQDECPPAKGTITFYQDHLQDAPFIPVMKRPPHHNLVWNGDNYKQDHFLKPNELYPVEMQSLVCCVKPIADDTIFPKDCSRLKEFLGMKRQDPGKEAVVQQLKVLLQHNVDPSNRNMLEDLNQIVHAVYGYLQSNCLDDEESRQSLVDELEDLPVVYINGRFLKPKQVAFNFQSHCTPYLFGVPDGITRQFKDLLSVLGVRERFTTSDYVEALMTMHQKFGETRLQKDDLRLALRLVNLLDEAVTDLDQTLDELVEVYGTINIPDADCVLRSSTELCYNEPNCQWVPGDENLRLSHPLIPYSISKQLGVNTRRQEVLKKHSMGIAFGQRERLTNRIRRILGSYPCDKEIMKELLQNADDAGASEIHFVKDVREHPKTRVFDESWKPLQGPALCVYNNRAFTEKDLVGIQKLGEGSKNADPNKTGQYGVGFNCVYHLTDAPSFLTRGSQIGETLCIFDPHAQFAPGATPEEPGRRFNDVPALRKIFTDVFPCYLEENFNMKEGTVFRFPLRTGDMALLSELADESFPLEKLDNLLGKFRMEMFDCLLFLNNISSVSISEIDRATNRLTNTYTVSVEMTEEDRTDQQIFSEYLKLVAAALKSGDMKVWDIPSREVCYTLNLKDSRGYWEKWLVVQKIGFEESESIPDSVYDAFRKGDLSLLPRGGVAALIDSADMDIAHRQKKAYCFLPLPVKTPLPVHINGHFALDHEARRNLWIDEDTGYKTDWNLLLLRLVIGKAYVTLLTQVPSMLLSSDKDASFVMSQTESMPDMEPYCSLFPKHNSHLYWRAVSQAVYKIIDFNQERVLPVMKTEEVTLRLSSTEGLDVRDGENVCIEWVSTVGDGKIIPYFDNLDESFLDESEGLPGFVTPRHRMKSTPKKKSKRDVLREVLMRTGFKLLCLPIQILENFMGADVHLKAISPSCVVDFFRTYNTADQACRIRSLPAAIGNTQFRSGAALHALVEYCMQDEEYFLDNLDGLPLCLGEDEQLRMFFMHDAPFLSSFHHLLPDCGFMFLHHQLAEGAFKNVNPDDHGVFERLDIPNLASLLMNVMPSDIYHNVNKHVPWSKDSKSPSPRWIKHLWTFLRYECNRLAELNAITEDELLPNLKLYMKALEKWCLLPVHVPSVVHMTASKLSLHESMELEASEHYLVPLQMAETVIDFTHVSIMSTGVRDSLRKLGVREISSKLLDCSGPTTPLSKSVFFSSTLDISTAGSLLLCNADLARQFVANLENPKSVLRVLEQCFKSRSENYELTKDECNTILKYFNDSLEQWINDPQAVATLKRLPLYYTIYHMLMGLEGNEIYLLPNDIPPADMNIWERQERTIFLQRLKPLTLLHEALGCQALTTPEVYRKFIFSSFHNLTPEAQLVHLEFLRDVKLKHCTSDEAEAILDGLRNLAFLEDTQNVLRTASYFYDPHHPVFKSLLSNKASAFPPAPFSGFKWLDLLRNIGLQHEVTADMFVDYAQNIAEEAREGATEDTFNRARTLVAHLFKRKNLPSESLLEQIHDIPFVPPVHVRAMLQKIHPQFCEVINSQYPYITFKGSIPETHEYLVWTSAPLLPDWANPYKLTAGDVDYDYDNQDPLHEIEKYKSEIGTILGIPDEPPLELVVNHVKNVCMDDMTASGIESDLKAYMKIDVMKVVYKYLQNKLVGNEEAEDELRDVRCLLVDKGSTMVKPRQVVINLFEEDQIIPFLYKAPTELGEFKRLFTFLGASLNVTVDQYISVLEMIYYATKGSKMHPNEMKAAFKAVKGLFSTLEKHPQANVYYEEAYLPTKIGCMMQSKDIVFNDDPSYTDRISFFDKPFLVDLGECGIQSTYHEGLIRMLPDRLQPLMLTSLVQEILEDRSKETVVEHGIAEKLRHQLNSKAFSSGVTRLVRHESFRCGQKQTKSHLAPIRDHLKRIQVFGVQKVITHLIYNHSRMPGSEIESECFVDKTTGDDSMDVWDIYIDNSATMSEELLVSVAEVVNRIIGGLLRNSVHYLQPILSCPPHMVSKVLDRLKIKPDHSVDFKEPTLPKPGDFIPLEDHHLLRDDMDIFEIGEYIGYELEDDETKGATFIYAIILEKMHLDQEGGKHTHFNQPYKINIGDDRNPIIALLPDLYTFHRVEGFVSRSASVADSYQDSFMGSTESIRKEPFKRTASADNIRGSRENIRASQENVTSSRENLHRGSAENLFTSRDATRDMPHDMPRDNIPRRGSEADASTRSTREQRFRQRRFMNRKGASFTEGFTGKIHEEPETEPRSQTPGGGDDYNQTDEPDHGNTGTGSSRFNRFSNQRQSFTSRSRKKFWWQDDKYDPKSKTKRTGEDSQQDYQSPPSEESRRPEPSYEKTYEKSYFERYGPTPDHGTHGFAYTASSSTDASSADMGYASTGGGAYQSPGASAFREEPEAHFYQPEEPRAEPAQPQPQPEQREQPSVDGKTFDEVLNEISDALEEAWDLNERNMRKKVIKRLLLKWHPDKNIGNESFATQVTQHIHSEVQRLEQGLPRPGVFEQFEFDVRNPFAGSTSFQQNFYSAYKFFFEQMNQRGKEHKAQRERYKENFSREYKQYPGTDQFNFDVPPTFTSTNPQPMQARRFYQQAQEDLKAASNDFTAVEPAYEWCCFKAHQAAEKALKAAQFSVDAVTSFNHDLTHLAATIENPELRRLAIRLQGIIGNANKFYNPDPIDFLVIPHDEFTRQKAEEAVRCAEDILDKVKSFFEIDENQ